MRADVLTAFAVFLLVGVAMAEYPKSKKVAVTDVYHGVSVKDDYRWLEDGNDAEVRQWSDAQNAHARSILDRLPNVAAIRARVTEIMTAKTVGYSAFAYRRGTLFGIKKQPPREQPFLAVITNLDDPGSERVLLDPNTMDAAGSTSIDWHEPSPDGKIVAVSLSQGGTETGDVHFIETATGKKVHEVIPRVNTGTAGGDLAWTSDGSGVYYTRHSPVDEKHPDDGKLRQQGYFHKLGTPVESDRYELGQDFLAIAEIEFEVDEHTGRVLASVQKGDGGEFSHFLRGTDGAWTQFAGFSDRIVQATFGPKDELLLISREGAPRGKILRLPINRLDLKAAEPFIPEGQDTVVSSFYRSPPSLLVTDSRIYVLYQLGGPSELRVFDFQGKRLEGPKQLPVSAVGGLTPLDGDDVLFSDTSFVEPPAFFRFRAQAGTTEKTWLATKSPVDFQDVKVVREFATSKDGTKVPLSIIMPRNAKLDGSNPTLATGYGGYGSSNAPSFSAIRRILLDNGFIFVDSNLRGGGEYGEPWHLQGNLTKKQNVFDDFAAVLKHLIDRKYTSPAHLAITGGSNGGLLMGATFTQHPDLMRAVVTHVGIYDMLRVELSPNGVFNIAEFGTVKNPQQFRALHSYSPYHRVKDGVRYPPVLFLTGANDPRVDPMQSRKMTARLQAATASNEPILLRTSSNSGHGGDTALSERIEQTVDVFAFLFHRLGISFKPAK